jgi:predicted transcriptional regulator
MTCIASLANHKPIRRNQMQLRLAVLDALKSKGPISGTKVMYKANLNYALTLKLLQNLMKAGQVKPIWIKKRMIWEITEAGSATLKSWKAIAFTLTLDDSDE